MKVDVAVLGSGPAGLAIASACGRTGMSVAIVSPNMGEPWSNRYGVFEDDTIVSVPHKTRYDQVSIAMEATRKSFARPYICVDQNALRDDLLRICSQTGVVPLEGRAEKIINHRSHTRVEWNEGEIYCQAVVDATGHRSEFVERAEGKALFQTAYGILFRCASDPFSRGEENRQCVLMEFGESSGENLDEPPSFLYAMAMGDDVYFAEETVLVAQEVVDFDLLASRLKQRLAGLGVTITEVLGEEHCVIPMGAGLPKAQSAVIGFGGAGSMVHPSTGYMLSTVLNLAPGVASTIEKNLGLHTMDLAESVTTEIWSPDARKRYALLQFGGRFLAQCNHAEICQFFDAFFSLPTDQWGNFMSGTQSSKEVAGTMFQVFKKAGLGTKGRLIASSMGDVGALVKALF